jgi:tetratricopeptide (TPR) repeat protein
MKRLVLILAAAGSLVAAIGCGKASSIDPEKQRLYATELLTRELYPEAIRAFEKYFELPAVSDKDRANALYALADGLFTKANDYHAALIFYLRLRSFYPDYPQISEVRARIVTCFERTGRIAEARRALAEAASGKPLPPDSAQGPIVAEFGGRKISEREVLAELEQLPVELRQQFGTLERKSELLRQVVGREILYDMAVKRGYADSPEFQRQIQQMRRDMLVQKIGEEQVGAVPDITETDVQRFYQEHRAELPRLPGGAVPTLQQIRPQIEAAARQEKQQAVFQQLVTQLFAAQQVKLYPERMR